MLYVSDLLCWHRQPLMALNLVTVPPSLHGKVISHKILRNHVGIDAFLVFVYCLMICSCTKTYIVYYDLLSTELNAVLFRDDWVRMLYASQEQVNIVYTLFCIKCDYYESRKHKYKLLMFCCCLLSVLCPGERRVHSPFNISTGDWRFYEQTKYSSNQWKQIQFFWILHSSLMILFFLL